VLLVACCGITLPAGAAGVPGALDELVVSARRIIGLAGEVSSASVGTVLGEQLEGRPLQRVGEVLEVVPGLIATQHSGGGKGNQFFLRGFNLDHGTDLATRIEGVPVNLPTHAHGQGYTDVNFLIPELIDRIEYRKGSYYPDYGNFSAAGAIDITYRRRLEQHLLALTGGQFSNARGLLALSPRWGDTDLLLAADLSYADGPWLLGEQFRRASTVAKLTRGDEAHGVQLQWMGYSGRWRSTDQIPQRAVDSGALDRFGNLDPTDGGTTHRYSLSARLWRPMGSGTVELQGYAADYGLDLFSNFTYATDPVNGDQFEQYDDRSFHGLELQYRPAVSGEGRLGTLRGGLQWRRDDIPTVGLYKTRGRQRLATLREDRVQQDSLAGWLSHDLRWRPWLRTEAGLRIDRFRFEVDSPIAPNSGVANDQQVSPKLAVVLGPWQHTELFLNWGHGFHSNDARGTTQRVDPLDPGMPLDPATPLVRARGAEVGLRSAAVPGLQLAASLWMLRLDSELVFVGDAGVTEPNRASRRHGLELSAYWTPTAHWMIDADLAWTQPRFRGADPAGNRIPNAVEYVGSVGLSYRAPAGWTGGARLRYLGPADLVEDGSARSRGSVITNLELGYPFSPRFSAALGLFNVFDVKTEDISYFYESQLPGETAPVEDIHFHPAEPRQVRVTVTAQF
jgi:hypothetical protein